MIFRTTSSAIALIALTAPAFADVTPAEVWQNWVEYYKANGYTVTEGQREEAGETLALKNVVFAFAAPKDEAKVEMTVPEVSLTATGDGKVRTTVAETSTVTASFKDEDGKQVSLNGTLVIKGAEMVTSGTVADMTHDFKAAETSANLIDFKTDEGVKAFPLTLKLLNAAGQQHVVDGPLMKIDATTTADRVEIDGTFDDRASEQKDGELPGKIAFKGGMDEMKGSGSFTMPKGVDLANDVNAGLKAGMVLSANLSVGAGDFSFDYEGKDENDADQKASGKGALKGYDLTFDMSAAGLKYAGNGDAANAEMTATDLPFPVSYAMDGSSFDLQMPVMKSDTPAPFKFAYSIAGLTIADGIWDLFDAGKKLPRDPASLDLDVTGQLKVNMDLFDPANMAPPAAEDASDTTDATASDATDADKAAEGATDSTAATDTAGTDATVEPMAEPVQPVEITINKLAVEAVGAKLDASGSVSVPEGGNIDAPVGKITARVDGVNALIDSLTAMGLIAEDQVAGARMMLAMFAKPAPEGGDALVSELEFKEGGEVLANGQKIK